MTRLRELEQSVLELDANGQPTPRNLRICVAGLLMEMAHADDQVLKEEYLQIVRSMDREYHLMDDEVGEVIDITEFLRRERPKLDEYIREVVRSYSPAQREHLHALLMQVAHADGFVHPAETRLSHFLRARLGIGGGE